MEIFKEGSALGSGEVSAQELELINTFSKKALSAEEVFTFSLILCDNDVDRDFERFSEKTLQELGELFVGKTGISDHEWKSGNQVARIYRTQVLRQPEKKTAAGDEYVCLKAWAYMLRTEENAGLIADIQGGIKKETSVGCSIGESTCSICGKPMDGSCGHVKGQEYGGKLCYAVLEGAVDAYEWSFVAVPAQRNAGVTKGFGGKGGLKAFVESKDGCGFAGEFQALEKQAAAGRKYMSLLKSEVLRLCLISDKALYPSLKCAVEGMDEESLSEMKAAFEKKAAEKMPLITQLPGTDEITRFDGDNYII
jgi:hypothetical protein